MQEYTEQQLDALAKKMMHSSKREKPSMDFTANVMKNIEHAVIGETIVYKPLISKGAWFIIIAIVVGVTAYLSLGNVQGVSWFDNVDFSTISNNRLVNTLSGITISKTLTYAIGICGLLFFVQIPLMKYLMNKRLEY